MILFVEDVNWQRTTSVSCRRRTKADNDGGAAGIDGEESTAGGGGGGAPFDWWQSSPGTHCRLLRLTGESVVSVGNGSNRTDLADSTIIPDEAFALSITKRN